MIQPSNNETQATHGAEIPHVQTRDATLTSSRHGRHVHLDASLEDPGSEDCESPAPNPTAFAASSQVTIARADDEIPEAFRELADTIAMLATVCFDAADAADTPAVMDPDESVDCDDLSDEDWDDGDPQTADSGIASSDGTLAAAAAGTTEYSLRIMEATCINTNAMVAFASAMLRAKSLSELVVITTAHARRQIETVADQTKQLAVAAHKMAPKNPV